jgi:hypothetical protein
LGLFSFIGGLLGASSAKKGVDKATAAQVDAYNKGIAEEQRQYDTTRADFAPYRDAGTAALPKINDLLGLNGPDAANAAIQALKQSPVYQSLYNNGQEALLANGAATGGLRGGNMQEGLADFGRDTLSGVIGDQVSKLGSLAGLGEGATNATAGFGANEADAVTKLLSGIGNAQASGALTKAGLTANMWNSAGSFLGQAASQIPGLGILSKIF